MPPCSPFGRKKAHFNLRSEIKGLFSRMGKVELAGTGIRRMKEPVKAAGFQE